MLIMLEKIIFIMKTGGISVSLLLPTSAQATCSDNFTEIYLQHFSIIFRQGLLSTMQNGTARPISIPVTHSWSNSHSPVRD